MAELSVMDRINMILSDPEKATMTLAQIVSEEIREFKASPEYAIMLEAESYALHRLKILPSTLVALPLRERAFIYASIDLQIEKEKKEAQKAKRKGKKGR